MKSCFTALIVLVFSWMQVPRAVAQSASELDTLRASYQRNLATIETARVARAEPIKRSYAADLELLQKEITSSGDLDGALQVKAERERLTNDKEPTAEERKAMLPAFSARRTRYEKEIEPIANMVRDALDQQKRGYVAALDALQRRLTVQNQLERAAQVRVERELISGPAADKAIPAATPAGNSELSPTAVAGAGQLDAGFAKKIADAISANGLSRTDLSSPKGAGGNETMSEGGVLVGFEFFETRSNGFPDIRSLRPYYLTPSGIKAGTDRGRLEKITNKVLARPGYAVAGINVYHIDPKGRIQGMQVIFMKMVPGEARLDHDSGSTYRSLWYGSIPHKEKPKELGGDGRPVVGVYGFHGADCDNIGLVQMSE